MHDDAYISLNICALGAVMHILSVLGATWIQAPSSERHLLGELDLRYTFPERHLAQGWAVCSCTRLLYKHMCYMHMCFCFGAPLGFCYNTVSLW